MKKMINHTPKLFKPELAETKAAELQAADEDWKYVVKHDPKGTGYSLIEIYDEDGIFVTYF